MTKVQGNPVWYELMTSDPAGAAAFYGAVLGWSARPSGQPGMDYQLLASPHGDVAGLMALPGGAPMPPGWFGYIGVDDLEASLAALTAAGGALHMPPTEVPGAGRFAMVADPQGVIFYLMQPAGSEPSLSFSTDLVGHCSWNELATTHQAAALGFYSTLFGWRAGDAMDMGPMGQYRFINHGDTGLGAMMTAPPGMPPGWTYYFRVADIDAAAAAVTKAGGHIDEGPSEVPGNDYIVQGRDPQGAAFALVGKRAG